MCVKQNTSDKNSDAPAGTSEGQPNTDAPMPHSGHTHHSTEVNPGIR